MTSETPHRVDIYVGKRLRAARNMKGISQEDAGAAVGVTFQQIQKYEKGSNRTSASRLIEFAVLFEKPVEWFFEGAPGYKGKASDASDVDVVGSFFELPYANDVAAAFVAIEHNHDRELVRRVAEALGRKAS